MPPKKPPTKSARLTTTPAAKAVAKTPPEGHPNEEEIAQAAYYRWLSRGGEHGDDEKDWFEAEQELLRKRGPAQKTVQPWTTWKK